MKRLSPRECTDNVPQGEFMSSKLIFFDLETSGLKAGYDEIVQLSAKSADMEISFYVKPQDRGKSKPERNVVSDLVLSNGQVFKGMSNFRKSIELDSIHLPDAMERFVSFCESFQSKVTLVAHNAQFDMRFIDLAISEDRILLQRFMNKCIGFLDSCSAARQLHPKSSNGPANHKLVTLLDFFARGEIQAVELHNSAVDVAALERIFHRMGKKEDFQPFTYLLSDYFRYPAIEASVAGWAKILPTRTLKREYLIRLAKNYSVQTLRSLATNGSQEEFVDMVASDCDFPTKKIVSIYRCLIETDQWPMQLN